jgi:hypothetical protein
MFKNKKGKWQQNIPPGSAMAKHLGKWSPRDWVYLLSLAEDAGLKKDSVTTKSEGEGIALTAPRKKDLQWILRIMNTIEPTKSSKKLNKLIDDIGNTPYGRKQTEKFFKSLAKK